jgi:hypothetical protein
MVSAYVGLWLRRDLFGNAASTEYMAYPIGDRFIRTIVCGMSQAAMIGATGMSMRS